ncbi:MAG: NADH-quinone oxidoreductase subunit L [Candidatus Hatepunaea meridiana]|nr:NADH-quinone oxidoreductase subunit L [Candidatus Hatepunaea meridiana]
MSNYLYLIPIIPFIGFLINGLLGKKLSDKAVGFIGCAVIGIAFAMSVAAFVELIGLEPHNRIIEHDWFTWLAAGKLTVDFGMLLDPLSAVMILVVSGVSFIIHIYSIGYMRGDPSYSRYFSYLNLFVFFMLLLVLGNSYPIMFIGWEGVGLCSYLLIGFWFTDDAKATAGKKAFIVNRIGDFGFLIGVFILFAAFGTLSFSGVAEQTQYWVGPKSIFFWATLCLFIGATGKSAQIPLYVWLPDAMAGPTPVSALIHAATMVTAGVYMVARNSFLFVMAPATLEIVAWVGVGTAIFAATIALVQNDIKKVLAYSTVSQLGYMFVGCGVGAFAAGISHLMTHAFFKALLFLGAGSVIHAVHHAHERGGFHGDPQDIRYMGNLRNKMPTTYWTFLVATLAIAGIPGFSGFFSKDEIIWQTFASGHLGIGIVAMIAALLTAFYMFRLVYMTFHGQWKGRRDQEDHLHESPKVMTMPLVILGVLSIIGGWVAIPHALGGGAWFEKFLHPSFALAEELAGKHGHHSLAAEYVVMIISVVIAVGGIFWARAWYIKNPEIPKRLAAKLKGLHKFALNKYYIDEAYDFVVVQTTIGMADGLWRWFDVKLVDGLVNGVAIFIGWVGSVIRKVQTGLIGNYALMMVFGIVVIVGYMVWR